MNRAEYINAVVHTAIERKEMTPEIGARILGAALSIMNSEGFIDEHLTAIWSTVQRRYGWVMQAGDPPW